MNEPTRMRRKQEAEWWSPPSQAMPTTFWTRIASQIITQLPYDRDQSVIPLCVKRRNAIPHTGVTSLGENGSVNKGPSLTAGDTAQKSPGLKTLPRCMIAQRNSLIRNRES